MDTTLRTLIDGPRNFVVHMTGIAGDTVQEVNAVKVPRRVKINEIQADIGGEGVVTLEWATNSAPEPFAQLSSGYSEFCYDHMGGLVNPNDGSGNVLLTTTGFIPGSTYDIVLHMVKK